MSDWAPKRFWTEASVRAVEGGYTVHLDARAVRTPAKAPLILPTEALAAAIAAEWEAQSGEVRPVTMPFTRAANSAIDKVVPLFDGVVDEIAGYGGSDLLCYRSEGPDDLVARQAAGWDPMLDWLTDTFGVALSVTAGIVPVDQPAAGQMRLRSEVAGQTAFQLAALHDLVAISGSLVLGLAVARGRLSAEAAFALSRIDETWQSEKWGADEEAAVAEAKRHQAFHDAARFYALCG